MKTPLEQLIEYSENVLKHSTINAHLIIEKAKQLLSAERKQIEYDSQENISFAEWIPAVCLSFGISPKGEAIYIMMDGSLKTSVEIQSLFNSRK